MFVKVGVFQTLITFDDHHIVHFNFLTFLQSSFKDDFMPDLAFDQILIS